MAALPDTNLLYGAIEAGGTKFVCAVGNDVNTILAKESFATTSPQVTLALAADFFRKALTQHGPIQAIGIGSFGPVQVQSGPHFGKIGSTPKPGWAGADILGDMQRLTGIACRIDTDVNCALLGELKWGAGVGYRDVIYLTIGTGIGGGIMVDGQLVYGRAHPEVGHMFVPKLEDDAAFVGGCPFHADRCIEGLAAGPALQKRWGVAADTLPPEHPCWSLQARYVAMLCANLLLTTAPRRIILGGGVMGQAHLFPLIRDNLCDQLHGYIDFVSAADNLDDFIVPAALGSRAGIAGCLELAKRTGAGK
jgi:fructokinase